MEKLITMKGAIFDLDGTLLDSTWLWAEIDRRFLSRRGIEVPSDYAEAIGAMEFYQGAAYTVERFGLSDTPEQLTREWTEMAKRAYAEEIRLKPYAREFLRSLAERGVKCAVATSSSDEMFIPALQNNGIRNTFVAIATTSEVGTGKSDPAVYLKAAEKLGLPPCDCTVFEDLPSGIIAAKKAGFYTVGVFDRLFDGQKSLLKELSDLFIEDWRLLLPQ